MARAVQRRQVPRLRLGFSSIVNAKVIKKFHENYKSMFAGCAIQLESGDPVFCLQHLDAKRPDCAILPLPIDANLYSVQPISRTPLVICTRTDDVLAERVQIDIREVAARITVIRDPEQYPSAHARLIPFASRHLLSSSHSVSSSPAQFKPGIPTPSSPSLVA